MPSRLLKRAVVVAVVAMRMMQVPVDQIVDVVAVRHCLVSASGPVLMPRLMTFAAVLRRAALGVLGRDLDHVLVDMVRVRVMQMPVVQIVDMIAVAHGGVAAARPVLVRMVGVVWLFARRHEAPL